MGAKLPTPLPDNIVKPKPPPAPPPIKATITDSLARADRAEEEAGELRKIVREKDKTIETLSIEVGKLTGELLVAKDLFKS